MCSQALLILITFGSLSWTCGNAHTDKSSSLDVKTPMYSKAELDDTLNMQDFLPGISKHLQNARKETVFQVLGMAI
jgi:hypothetical protein